MMIKQVLIQSPKIQLLVQILKLKTRNLVLLILKDLMILTISKIFFLKNIFTLSIKYNQQK